MINKTIAITGATGQFGAIALDLIKAKSVNVIALVRSPEKFQVRKPANLTIQKWKVK
ncbi:hypothetical protein SA508_04830, partial [Aggregatibacter actinomycetemcomitans serotype d str. SA508]